MGAIRTPDQRLRVFVSSTLGELAEERRAARAAIEQLRLTPVMFELGARPHPPRALYRSYLAQSDVFVGIYWQRYGWIGPDMEVSGLEDEFLLSGELPRLLYVKRPAPDIEPRLGEMLGRMQEEDTASYKPFASADELQELLIDDLAILLAERFDAGRDAPISTPARRHNLPSPTSTFLGREGEIRELTRLIADETIRLITLTGPGGTGKTRLAIQVASDHVERFAHGLFFVDLSGESGPEEAFAAVARVVGAVVPTGARPLEVLEAELRDREVCLVLDNFEQLVSAGAAIVELLEHCPDLTVLVTSREALRVRGEHIFPVPPLALPDPRDASAPVESEAVQLFAERAADVRPGFRIEPGNADDIVAICRSLDGLPLAIELAAARVQVFDPKDLRARLEGRFDVLKGGARDLPKRQQTLHDAITWSYDLLSPDERRGLCLFSVFSGARLADFDAIASNVTELANVDVIEVLASLIDKSLVQSTEGFDGRPRFSMLQTLRAYAIEELEATPEFASAARRAHAEHYTEAASRVHEQLARVGRTVVLSALSDELSNLRAAWDAWVVQGDVARLNDLLPSLWGYYDARGDYRSAIELGRDLLDCLAVTPDSPDRRRHEFVVHMNLVRTEIAVRGFTLEAEEIIGAALARAAADLDGRQRFPGLRSLAYLHLMRTEYVRMDEIARELMDIAEREQDQLLLSEAHLLAGLSRASLESDFPAALHHYDRAIQHCDATHSGYVDFRVGPNPGVVANVVSGLTHWIVGQPDTAAITMQRALEQAAGLDHPYSIAYALHHAGLLDLWRLDLTSVAARAEALLAIATVHDYPAWRALALVLGGVAVVGSGEVDAGLAQLEEGFGLYKGLSTPLVFWPALLAVRAEALRMAGRSDDGLAVVEEALAAVQPGDVMAAEVSIVRGDLLLALSPPDLAAAEAELEQVAARSADRGARMAQVRALTRLADLRRGTPAEGAARRALQDVYSTFVEGFDSPQLVAARAALAEQA